MRIDIDAIRAQAEQHAQALGPGGEKAWLAGLLAAAVPGLLAEIKRLTDSEDSRVVALEAELERSLRREQDLRHRILAAKPVLDAAREVREAESASPYLACTQVMLELIAAVDEFDRCPSCGPGGCAGHTKAVADAEA